MTESSFAAHGFAQTPGAPRRELPAATEAEQALLGTILVNNVAFEHVSSYLRPHHFYDPVHARLFEMIGKRLEDGLVCDTTTMRPLVMHAEWMRDVGMDYFSSLIIAHVSVLSANSYGRAILDAYKRRELIAYAESLAERAYAADEENVADRQIEDARSMLDTIEAESENTVTMMTLGRAADQAVAASELAYRMGGRLGIPTGLREIDDIILGMDDGDLLILAGRPAMGKTALALQVALRVAARHIVYKHELAELRDRGFNPPEKLEPAGVGIISLEMQGRQLAARALGLMGRLRVSDILTGEAYRPGNQRLCDSLIEARGTLHDLPVVIEDEPNLRIGKIAMRARGMDRRLRKNWGAPLRLLVIDHLHIVGREPGTDSETAAITAISNGAKRLAKKLGIPVLLLAQLSRANENRTDKRPGLPDLRQSGSIEQDADVAMFVHRPEYYLKNPPEQTVDEGGREYAERLERFEELRRDVEGVAEILIPKVRQGQPGTARLTFDGPTTRFYSSEHDRNQLT